MAKMVAAPTAPFPSFLRMVEKFWEDGDMQLVRCASGGDRPLVLNGRCGPGTRIPFLVISPWSNQNYVYHDRISQASIVRFIEDNWLNGERLGGGSFDATSGSIMPMFDFRASGHAPKLILDQTTGERADEGKGNGEWH